MHARMTSMGRFPVSPCDLFLPALPVCEVLFHSLSLEQQQFTFRKNMTHECHPLHLISPASANSQLGGNLGDVFIHYALPSSEFFKRQAVCSKRSRTAILKRLKGSGVLICSSRLPFCAVRMKFTSSFALPLRPGLFTYIRTHL